MIRQGPENMLFICHTNINLQMSNSAQTSMQSQLHSSIIQTPIFTFYKQKLKTDWYFPLFQEWRRLRVRRHSMCQTTWTIQSTFLSSKALLLASDPRACQRISLSVSSCWKHPNLPLFPASPYHSVSVCLCVMSLTLSSASLLSRLWGRDDEPVGMPSIPNVTFVLIWRMKDYLHAWFHVKQSHSPRAACWFSSAVSVLKCRTDDQPMRPFLKENLPKRMHFAKNERIERGHLYMEQGWQAAL